MGKYTKKQKSLIPKELARQLNFHRAMCLGAVGTTSLPYRLYTTGATPEMLAFIKEFDKRIAAIKELLKEEALAVENFYLLFGSANAKERITKRRELELKIARCEDLTDEEMAVYLGKPVKTIKQQKQATERSKGARTLANALNW